MRVTSFSAADLLIHNGADVSYLKGYSTLRPANLESTKELAALCLPRRVPFHYISTAGVGMFAAKALGPDRVFTAASAANSPPPADVSPVKGSGHSYAAMTATKWARERFLERVVAANGGPQWLVFIHRPSLIVHAGWADPGLGLVRNIQRYARRLHAVPVIRNDDGRCRASGSLDLVTLDLVVRGGPGGCDGCRRARRKNTLHTPSWRGQTSHRGFDIFNTTGCRERVGKRGHRTG